MTRQPRSRSLGLLLLVAAQTFLGPLRATPAPESRTNEERPTGGETTRHAAPAPTRILGDQPLRGPVDDEEYIVGPGDGFVITIAGASVDSHRTVVTPEGFVVLPGVATTEVAGLRLVEAKKALREALSRRYRNIEVYIALVDLRRIEVHVIGHVVRPGTYSGTALDPTSSVIESAGGLAENASQRNIRVTRRNGEVRTIDLVRYERLADLNANPPILDGDVIFVPFTKTRVRVDGAVEEPGIYEFVEGDTLGALVDIAGGLTHDARSDSIEVRRFVDDVATEEMFVPLDPSRGMKLEDGDQLYVRFLTDHRPMTAVTLEGEFRHPGPYGIREGADRLSDVIDRAGGFTDEAPLEEAALIRTIGVDKLDPEYERLKEIPVQDMSETEYAYFKSKARERKGLVVVDIARLAAGDEDEDRIVRNGDRLIVPKKRATVTVSGSVKFPGLITYEPDRKASHYIKKAGGYASRADGGDARVIRGVTGEWEPAGSAERIVPGDEVWVPERPERDWWQFTQDAVRFAASVATVYLVIQQATD